MERKDDAELVRCCTVMEIDGTGWRVWRGKTWWDGDKENMKRF